MFWHLTGLTPVPVFCWSSIVKHGSLLFVYLCVWEECGVDIHWLQQASESPEGRVKTQLAGPRPLIQQVSAVETLDFYQVPGDAAAAATVVAYPTLRINDIEIPLSETVQHG